MTEGLLNLMRREASKVLDGLAKTELAAVTSYNPATYSVKVLIGSSEIESGWLPLGTVMAGPGYGVFMPPFPGDLVDVHFVEGDLQNGYSAMRFFQKGWVGANKAVSGDMWFINKAGVELKLNHDGTVEIAEPGGKKLVIDAAGAHVTGNLAVTGNETVSGTLAVTGALTSAAAYTGDLITGDGKTATVVGGIIVAVV